jgi:hypothetical protein
MIYLDDKITALTKYNKAACWLGVKIKGRQTARNINGYNCGNSACEYCAGSSKRRSGLDPDYTNLFTDNIIKELINAKPQRLLDIYDDLSTQYILLGKTIVKFNSESSALFVDSGYTDWFLKEKWNYTMAREIDQHTCTYCNREYIFVYEKKGRGKGMVPQFDHWFSKTDYPLLAMSFYNLIPSCSTCNTIKSATPFNLSTHLHPYIDKNIASSYSFSFLSKSITSNKIIFRIKSINSKAIDTVKDLNLELIYEGHSSRELQDLIDLKYKYSKSYLNILLDKTFEGLNLSEQERYRLIFGIEIDEDKYHKRIFSKFKKDIIDELLSIDS